MRLTRSSNGMKSHTSYARSGIEEVFQEFIAIATGSSNGRTRDFGSRYPGSSPGPVAMNRN